MRILPFFLLLLLMAGPALGQAEPQPEPALPPPSEPVFTVIRDENLPLDELSLLLDPTTREDLVREVAIWQALLKNKLRAISEVQITLKYLNQDSQVFKDAQDTMNEFLSVSQVLFDSRAAAVEDTTQATADNLRTLEQELIEVRLRLVTAVNKAIAREARAYQVNNLVVILAAAVESLEEQKDLDRYGEFNTVDQGLAQLRARVRETGREFDPGDEELMAMVTTELEEILKRKAGVNDLVVAYLANLMDDRGELVKRLRVVVREWEKKGAPPEEVAPVRIFVNEVTKFQLDVADQATRWSLVGLWLKSEDGGIKQAKNVGRFLAMMLFFVLLAMLVGAVTQKALHRTENVSQLMKSFIIRSIRRVILLVGFMMSLSALGVNIGPILGVVGAAGFILAFALQSTLGNFASGVMIMIYKPFDVGDAIDAAGVMGVVKTMNLTSTIINTFDNKLVIVPNNSIWGSVITNITGSQTRRVDLVFRIGYNDDTELAEKIIHEVLAAQELILKEPEPIVKIHELSDFTVNFICRPWVETTDYWNVRWELTRMIRERFAEAGFAAPVDPGAYIKRVGGAQP